MSDEPVRCTSTHDGDQCSAEQGHLDRAYPHHFKKSKGYWGYVKTWWPDESDEHRSDT